jgi:hypothetical protein
VLPGDDPADPALGLRQRHAAQPQPGTVGVATGRQVRVGRGPDPSRLRAAVALLDRAPGRARDSPEAGRLRRGEPSLHRRPQNRLVALAGEHVVSAVVDDPAGDRGLAADGVDRHGAAVERQ